jgi:Dolichyl-phosphate-mannose-protein mannosyltransferase
MSAAEPPAGHRTTTDRPARRLRRFGLGRVDLFTVAAVLVVAAVLPLFLTSYYGALDVPRSDDWSYLVTLFRWYETGEWNFNDWVSMTLVGQVYISAPVVAVFGDSIVAVRVLVVTLGAVGLVATYGCARSMHVDRWLAALIVGSVASGPLWGPLAVSYMTDVPAFAFQALAVAFAVVALGRGHIRIGWFLAALGAAVFAVAIRQYAVVTLAAVAIPGLLVAHRDSRPASRRRAWWSVAFAAIGVLGVLAWWSGVPERLALEPRLPNGAALRLAFTSVGGFLRLVALLQAPVVIAVGPTRLVRAAIEASRQVTIIVASATAMILTASWALSPDVLYVGNYLDRRGTLGDVIIHGNRPDLVPRWIFDALALGASVLALTLVIALVPVLVRIRERGALESLRHLRVDVDGTDLVIGLALFGLFTAYELAILLRLPIFDRYALSGVPLVGIAIASRARAIAALEVGIPGRRPTSPSHRAKVGLALVGLAVLGAAYTADSAAFDAGRWHAAQAAVAAGLEPRDIDAGYEWNGWHRGVAPGVRPSIEERKRLRRKYVEGLCAQVVVDPVRVPGRAIAVIEVPGWFRASAYLFVVPTGRDCASGVDIERLEPAAPASR